MEPRSRRGGALLRILAVPGLAVPGLAALVPLAAPVLFATPGNDRVPDTVELANGAKIEGRVVFEDATRILLLTGGGEKSFDKKNVKSFRSRAQLHDNLFDRWIGLADEKPAPLLDLARMAKQTDLLEDSACFAARALLLDSASGDAHELLGHRKRGSSWDFELKKDRWLPVEKLLSNRPDWEEATDFASMHYVVRTNFGLRQQVDAALDLECLYRAFFRLFGADLELREVLDPMTVEIHADKRSFPGIATGRAAYTDGQRNVVEIDASGGSKVDTRELFHEGTHQLVASLTHFAFNANGAIPGWLGEGLAEYMACGMSGMPGRRSFSEESILLEHFAVHASAKTPYDLSRVLSFEADDFLASSKSDLKYAQAYTLVQFCMDGDGGKHRKGFVEFLRGVWRGRKAPADFKKALGIDEKAFQKAWVAHVRAHAK